MYVCVYVRMYIWGFRARQHLRPLEPVMNDNNDGQMIFGNLGGLKLPTFVLQVRKNLEKTSPRKLVPTGDQTWVRCVTGAYATAWPTELNNSLYTFLKIHILYELDVILYLLWLSLVKWNGAVF